tara:strand:+ start:289 stop:1047 length:759 start_codon:yes stop_codon:yes gene_type:complete
MRFFIDISYDGTNYHGWQIQPNAITVQKQINIALSTILNSDISVVGAGRTDAGVHAKQLIAHFDFEDDIDLIKIKNNLNGFLDNDISINNIFKVKDYAHARFSAISRTYQYQISKLKDPFLRQSYLVKRKINIREMNNACKLLIGEKDFSAFAKLHSDNYTNMCNIYFANWKEDSNLIVFTIKANRFLRNMVRAIVGTMLEIGDGKIKYKEVENIISSKDRTKARYSVPALGLSLVNVEYENDIIDERNQNR